MSGKLPSFLKYGDPARLIPVVADTSREKRLASVLLAGTVAVPDFANALFSSIGQRIGKRTKVEAFTEVLPHQTPNDLKERPDGLIIISTGHRKWSAFVEAKIGNNELQAEQVERYIELAKLNGVDSVITISNQFTARPDHHPVRLDRRIIKKVELYHWSWMSILTRASLLQMDESVEDSTQGFILDELIRFFSHDSAGIDGFDRMNKEWKDIVQTVRSGGILNKKSVEVEKAVASWHEEERDLCLLMSRHLGRPVRLKLERKYRDAPLERLKDDCEQLASNAILECALQVPDAAGDMLVRADLRRRTVACLMRLEAPKDKKSTKARVNWLLRQFPKANDPDIHVRAMWPSRTPDTMEMLSHVRDNPNVLQSENPKQAPHSFEVILIRDIAGRFSGTRTFIEHVEEIVPHFYDQIGQHLRPWQPSPPKPRGVTDNVTETDAEEAANEEYVDQTA